MDEDDINIHDFKGHSAGIRITGVSLLPVLITKEKRMELENYKQKALEVERRLKFQRELKQFFEQFRLADFSPQDIKSCGRILDDILFDNDISHINALNIVSPTIKNDENIVPFIDKNKISSKSELPFKNVSDSEQSSDVGEVTRKLSASTVELDLTDAVTTNHKELPLVMSETPTSDQYEFPLLRSKTFVLSAPSPILLKHLKSRPHTSPAVYNKTCDLEDLDLRSTSSNPIDFRNFQDIAARSEDQMRSEVTSSFLIDLDSINSSFQSGCDCNLSNKEEYLFINQTISKSTPNIPTTSTENCLVFENTWSNNSMMTSEDLNFSTKEDDHQSNSEVVLLSNSCNATDLDHPHISENCNESKSIYFESQSFVFSNNDLLSTSTPNLIDLECNSCDIEAASSSKHDVPFTCDVNNELPLNYANAGGVIMDLYLNRPDKAQRRMREKWAAGVLTAAARGYLVRRLKRTERVQILVQTIRDALLCAISLHTESSESIQSSDIELHRRLIQQVLY